MRKLTTTELERKTVEEFKKSKKNSIVVVLDNIRSLNNIGSIFRTCDAFLIEKIILCGITAKPPHRDIHKTALGATETVNWEYYNNTLDAIEFLKKDNCVIVSVEQVNKGTYFKDFKVDKSLKYALVFGNEVNGVDQKVIDKSDKCIEIRQYGVKHSLNISVSVGIVIWGFITKLTRC